MNMRTIHKHEIRHTHTTVTMPTGARIVHVANQRETACIWFDCDDSNELIRRDFRVFGTGHEVPEGLSYVGSVLVAEGTVVWHVFEDA